MNMKRIISLLLVVLMCMTALTTGLTVAAAEPETEPVGFAAEFANPDDLAYKPHMRWWISPGTMEEEETRREVRLFAEAGFSGMELISMGATAHIHSEEWNRVMSWILDEAEKCGVEIDFTLGEFWPIATYDIPVDEMYTDERTEKRLVVGAANVTVAAENLTVATEGWAFPAANQLNQAQHWDLVAVTVAKKNGSNYDPATALDITELVNLETGAVSWEAPSEGDWTVFYSYMQSTGKTLQGGDYLVIDHMNKDATKIITDAFDRDFAYELEDGRTLGDLYKAAGGYFFGDSFEVSSCTLWTATFLEEFEARRGYDLTPYLPTIFHTSAYTNALDRRTYEFDEIGAKVRMDYGRTLSELVAENHLQEFNDWADETVGMGLRYQVHSSKGGLFLDETVGNQHVDIAETESYALGNSLDQYRLKSGVAHMMGHLLTSETAAANNMSWRQSWTGTPNEAGSTNRDLGFLRYASRLFAAGVNKLYFHGTSYDRTGGTISFPGYALMAGMDYPNEWDEHTPLWEYMPEMMAYLTRTQMVLQQGKGDIDLAYYRLQTAYTRNDLQAAPRAINKAGYNYDFVTESMLEMENAVLGEKLGETVLAPDGPSYKALVLDLKPSSGQAYPMAVETAKTILGFAEGGLPVVVVGAAPSMVAGLTGTDAELQAVMEDLMELAIFVPDGNDLAAVLQENGIYPDANPNVSGENMFYHRFDGEVDYYFVANDSNNAVQAQTVTFAGEGRPYILNAWNGEIEPVAAYTAADNGVTFDIELAPGEQMLVAVAPHGWCGTETLPAVATDADSADYDGNNVVINTTEAGTYTVELSDGSVRQVYAPAAEEAFTPESWSLVVHQWLPVNLDNPRENPYDKQIVDSATYTLPGNDLKAWYEIDNENLLHAAGVGEYTTTFTLEKGWAEGQGAILSFTDASDCMEVIVNGENVTVNQLNSTVDIGPKLVAGENTIVVKVSSTMGNYMFAKANSGMMGSATKEQNTFKFGILGESKITPYVRTTVYDPDAVVTVNLTGEATATVDAEELVYNVTAENTAGLATATLVFEVDGLVDPAVVPADGWYVIAETAENGIVTAVLCNNAGVTSAEAVSIASLTGKFDGMGTVTVALTEAVLSSYAGSGEAFDFVTMGEVLVSTEVTYSVFDVNQDGTVNQLDITRAQRFFGTDDPICNVDGEGDVGIADLVLILNNYSK